MKLLALLCVLSIPVSACGPHFIRNSPDPGSSLKGIQDQEHQLKLEEVPGISKTYEFKTCVSNTPHCVAAFQNPAGEAVTFQLDTLTHRALTEADKTRLLRLHSHWHSYQTQLNTRKGIQIGGAVATGAVVMGGARETTKAGGVYLTARKKYLALKTDFDRYRSLKTADNTVLIETQNRLWLAEHGLEWKLEDLRSTIKKTAGRALMIITAGALSTMYLLHLAKKQTKEAQEQTDEVNSHLDDLTVILGPSSPLFTADEEEAQSLEVPSLERILPLLASWLSTPKEDTPAISEWCLPKVSENLGVEASCQKAS